MSCGIHNGCKMFISVHQYMRNTLNIKKEICIRRRFNTSKKTFRPIPLIKFSDRSIKDITIQNEHRGSIVFSNKHQFVVPLACNLYSNECKPQVEDKKQKQSIYKKFTTMFKEYWFVLVPVHLVTSCFWIGSFYYMAASGVDIPSLMENLGAPDSWVEKFKNTKAGNLVVAYTLYKVMTPIRYTVTVGGTSLSIKHLKQWGLIKPAPNKEQFKKLYEEQKDALKGFKSTCQDKMQVTKNEFLKTKDEMKKQIEIAKEEFHKSVSESRADFKQCLKGVEELKIISKAFSRDVKDAVENLKKKQND